MLRLLAAQVDALRFELSMSHASDEVGGQPPGLEMVVLAHRIS